MSQAPKNPRPLNQKESNDNIEVIHQFPDLYAWHNESAQGRLTARIIRQRSNGKVFLDVREYFANAEVEGYTYKGMRLSRRDIFKLRNIFPKALDMLRDLEEPASTEAPSSTPTNDLTSTDDKSDGS